MGTGEDYSGWRAYLFAIAPRRLTTEGCLSIYRTTYKPENPEESVCVEEDREESEKGVGFHVGDDGPYILLSPDSDKNGKCFPPKKQSINPS